MIEFHYTNSASGNKYFSAENPLIDVHHIGVLPSGAHLGTGQPFQLLTDTKQELADFLYDNQYVVESDVSDLEISGDWQAVQWSVGYYTSAEAYEVASVVNENDFVHIEPLKHPGRDEWCIPYQGSVLVSIPPGSGLDYLIAKSAESVAEGNRVETSAMIASGWV